MASGEGIGFGAAAVATIAGGGLLIWLGDWLGRAWGAMIERDLATADASAADRLRAEAMVPEYAAALRGPCPCRNCRMRYRQGPCSDFDGD